jgi:hypothetical protein
MARRFLEDHRKPVAGYDRVRFSEAEIASLRARIDVPTPLTVRWEWDYVSEVETLRKLYERGKGAQWNAEHDVDWSVEVRDDHWVMSRDSSGIAKILELAGADEATLKRAVHQELEHGISQLLHGEQAALQLCAQLVNTVPAMDTKLFAGQQVVDECRHVEVFAKLLSRKFGTVHPIDPNIKFLLDEMLACESWHKKAIGMQVLFEGVAMAVITHTGQTTLNPLVRQVMRYVARDEARHAAFGVLALREELPRLSQAERDELEDWTWRCLEIVANGLASGMIDYVAPRFGLDPDNVASAFFGNSSFWDARYHMFNHTVLPNLKKLGIIGSRTRACYDQFKLLEPIAPHGSVPTPSEDFLAGA